jgi:hypothetical protein
MMPETSGRLRLAFLLLATVLLPRTADAASCNDEIGPKQAGRLVEECRNLSPATHPPCNGANSCALIRGEVLRACRWTIEFNARNGIQSPADVACTDRTLADQIADLLRAYHKIDLPNHCLNIKFEDSTSNSEDRMAVVMPIPKAECQSLFLFSLPKSFTLKISDKGDIRLETQHGDVGLTVR